MPHRKRREARDAKYAPISMTITGRITKSHEEDGVTVIDDIEITSVGGVPTDWLKLIAQRPAADPEGEPT